MLYEVHSGTFIKGKSCTKAGIPDVLCHVTPPFPLLPDVVSALILTVLCRN